MSVVVVALDSVPLVLYDICVSLLVYLCLTGTGPADQVVPRKSGHLFVRSLLVG